MARFFNTAILFDIKKKVISSKPYHYLLLICSTLIISNLSYANTNSRHIEDNNYQNCQELDPKAVKQVISDIQARKYSTSELSNCQSRSYRLFEILMTINPDLLQYAHISIRNNDTFIKNYIKSYHQILEHISDSLKSDPLFFKHAIKLYEKALQYADDTLLDNRQFMKYAVAFNAKNFIYASARLRNDQDFTKFAVKIDGRVLKYASEEMQTEPKVVLDAIKSYSIASEYDLETTRRDGDIREVAKESDYTFLIAIESFLQKNYAGTPIGPNGSRGYRIVNQAKLLDQDPIINRKDFFQWRYWWKNNKNLGNIVSVGKLKNLSWKQDLQEYPNLSKKINYILKKYLNQNTINAMTLTSLWQVSNNPEILVFKIYLLRSIENSYNKLNINNTSYLIGIAQADKVVDPLLDNISNINNDQTIPLNKELKEDLSINDLANINELINDKNNLEDQKNSQKRKWFVSVIDTNLDINLANNIILKNNHKEYQFWDVYVDEEQKNTNIIFKVTGKNSEYFDIFSKQHNNLYKSIYKGGGYNFNY